MDAEGSFKVFVPKDTRKSTGWRVRAVFSIALHKKDLDTLLHIQAYFGGAGTIKKKHEQSLVYRIYDLEKIAAVILHHFDLFPLISQKAADYMLVKHVVELMGKGKHLILEGLETIIAIKAAPLNKGLSVGLKEAFPHIIPAARRSKLDLIIPNPYWVAGFTSGEGCFDINVTNYHYVSMRFRVTQHIRDKALLESLNYYLACGNYSEGKNNKYGQYKCSKFSDIINVIIPFFKQYNVVGVKAIDLQDWCKVAYIIKTGKRLTVPGLAEILQIKKKMNRGKSNTDE